MRCGLLAGFDAGLPAPGRKLPRGAGVDAGLSAVLHLGLRGGRRGGWPLLLRCPTGLVIHVAVAALLVCAWLASVVSVILQSEGGKRKISLSAFPLEAGV